MAVPVIARSFAALVVAALVFTAVASAVATLIVARPAAHRLTRWVDRIVDHGFRLATKLINDPQRRDRVLAGQMAAVLLSQLAAWLTLSFFG
jgi:hypothetical protein